MPESRGKKNQNQYFLYLSLMMIHFFVFSSPWRIIDDCGGAFTMGLIGGSLFNVINGARHAPSGWSRRAMGGMIRMKERAPVLGGQFAAWGLCFSTFDCTFAHLR